MPRNHHATTTTTVDVDFDCAACGYAGIVAVNGEGVGTAMSFVGFDRDHARRVATEEAVAEATHQARVTAALIPCPRCHRRARGAVFQHVLWTSLGALALLALTAGVRWIDTGFRATVAAGLFLAGAIALVVRKRRQFVAAGTLGSTMRVRAVVPAAKVVRAGAVVPTPTRAPEPQPERESAPRLLR